MYRSLQVVRLQKDVAGVQSRLDKLNGKMSLDTYTTKCPAATQVRSLSLSLSCPLAPFCYICSMVCPIPGPPWYARASGEECY